MAKINNPWVGYLDRSYQQIKNSLLLRLGRIVPEVTDHSESNILVIILSMFAGITEQLNYYIDNMAREAFITTARRYSSVVKHTRLIDYRIKAAIPASVDVKIDLHQETEAEQTFPYYLAFTIPRGTKLSTANAIEFTITKDVHFEHPKRVGNLPVEQKTLMSNVHLGTTTGSIGQIFSLGVDYVHDSLQLEIGGEVWERVDTLGRSGPHAKEYVIDISVDKVAYIVFGDNVNGKNPDANLDLFGTYYICRGAEGNVDIGTIVNIEFDFSPYLDESKVEIENLLKAVAGSGYETIKQIQRSAPLSLRTLDRAVTRQDYIDIAKLAPGVDKATLHYDCGKIIDLYISPHGGGIAPEALLTSTKNYVEARKMVTTQIQVYPAGESYVQLKLEVTARFRRDANQTRQDIIEAITDKYSYENSDVNRKIRTSDIIALVDNLPSVDYLELEEIYVKPYIRPIGHITELLNSIQIREGSSTIVKWEIRYYLGVMKLFKEGVYVIDIPMSQVILEPQNHFSIVITPNNYSNGEVWEFTTFPYNENLEISDFTVPIIREQDIDVNVNEQLIQN